MRNLTKLVWVWFAVISLLVPLVSLPLSAESKTDEVVSLIECLQLGRPFNYRNLTILPIYSTSIIDKTDYVTLDEAVRKGYILITEIEGGRVPQVKVTNKSERYIFLMAGEILTGARQNRLVGKDVLLGPKNKGVIVPVYCVEQGRWDAKSYEFSSGDIAATPTFREYAAKSVSQAEMWKGVSSYSAALGVRSATGDLSSAYRDNRIKERAQKYVEALKDIPRLDEDAVGIAVVIGNRIVAIDIFGKPRLFSDLWPKLLRSYAMGAVGSNEEDAKVTQGQVKRILNQLYERRYERKDGIALGDELSTTTAEITSIALTYKGNVIHLSAFPNEDRKGPIIDTERVPVIFD